MGQTDGTVRVLRFGGEDSGDEEKCPARVPRWNLGHIQSDSEEQQGPSHLYKVCLLAAPPPPPCQARGQLSSKARPA